MTLFIAISEVAKKKRKLPTCPSVGEWVSKLWYIHLLHHVQWKWKHDNYTNQHTWITKQITETTSRLIPFVENQKACKTKWYII